MVFRADSLAVDEEDDNPNGKDDWKNAIRFRDIQRLGNLEPKRKKELSARAIQSVLDRARESMGPIQKPYRYQHLIESEAMIHAANGAVTELDIEETLFHHSGNRSVNRESIFQVRTEKDHGILLLLDTSLSMKGEKLALLAVTVAAVIESVPAQALCVLGFDSEIHAIKEFAESIPAIVAIERVLSVPPGGFTHIECALVTARKRIEASRFPLARVILVSDGRYTEGKNPVEEARNFRFVYPVKLGKDPGGRAVMREIADTGQGRFAEVREMKDLPRFLLNAVRAWVR